MLFSKLLLAQPAQDVHDECQEKIRKLEERVAALEQMLARLTPPENRVTTAVVTAPAPSTAVPATPKSGFETPPELVPEIGKLGAEVGVIAAGSSTPFQLNGGTSGAAFVDLPLFDKPDWLHGKISYEILVGLSRSQTTFPTTSNVAQIANLAVLDAVYPNGGQQNITAAVTGTGAAPFPVTTNTQVRLTLLEVAPFALKYTNTALDRWRLRPYGIAGFGAFVAIHSENPVTPALGVRPDADLPPAIVAAVDKLFAGSAPFGSPLVAGQIGQSPELESRGLPTGHGDVEVGWFAGGGLEVRLSRSLSIGFDGRYNQISGANGSFYTLGSRIALHF